MGVSLKRVIRLKASPVFLCCKSVKAPGKTCLLSLRPRPRQDTRMLSLGLALLNKWERFRLCYLQRDLNESGQGEDEAFRGIGLSCDLKPPYPQALWLRQGLHLR